MIQAVRDEGFPFCIFRINRLAPPNAHRVWRSMKTCDVRAFSVAESRDRNRDLNREWARDRNRELSPELKRPRSRTIPRLQPQRLHQQVLLIAPIRLPHAGIVKTRAMTLRRRLISRAQRIVRVVVDWCGR